MLIHKPICQSCSLPVRPGHWGTEADQSLSDAYCMDCYADGWFTEPDMPLEEMQVIVVEAMQKRHLPRFIARAASKKVPELKRWS